MNMTISQNETMFGSATAEPVKSECCSIDGLEFRDLLRVIMEAHDDRDECCELEMAMANGNVAIGITMALDGSEHAPNAIIDEHRHMTAQLYRYTGEYAKGDRLPRCLEDPFDKRCFGDLPTLAEGDPMRLARHGGWILDPINEIEIRVITPGADMDPMLPAAIQDAASWYARLGRPIAYVEVLWEDEASTPVMEWFINEVVAVVAPGCETLVRRTLIDDRVTILPPASAGPVPTRYIIG